MLQEFREDKHKRTLVNEFLTNCALPKYVLGRNAYAAKVASTVSIDAFIDDFTEECYFLGKPVIKSSEVKENAIVVSCSLAIYPHSALRVLEDYGVENILHFLDFATYRDDSNLLMPFIEEARNDINLNYKEYEWLYEKLGDKESQKTFLDLLNFRKNRDLSYLSSYKVDFIGQYFEEFLKLKEGEVFVDVGAYDGSTSIEFIKHCPEYKSVYIFEPSVPNLTLAKEKLGKHQRINFFPVGLSDKKAILKFDAHAGSASTFTEDGNDSIQVDKLDDLVNEKVSFIKMDIEGAEKNAILGMAEHIINDHPKLAVSVYHRPKDFWEIPKQILEFRSDYDVFIRHYTEGTDETVMFFMPKNLVGR